MNAVANAVTLPSWLRFDDLPRAYGEPPVRGVLRARPEDFIVEEELAFGPDGEGEHCLLRVRKTGANTEWTARLLARLCGIPAKAVGYAGLKDRHAVTTQWFSVLLGNQQPPDWSPLEAEGIEVLECHRHRRKLRRGLLAANHFRLRLRAVQGDLDGLAQRLKTIAIDGVPNYFGPQRFGHDDGNLIRADALFRTQSGIQSDNQTSAKGGRRGARQPDRHQRGLWLSAARSQLFNEVLATRVQQRTWRQALPGERLQLFGSHSHFLAEQIDDDIRARVDSGDLQPTGPLFGAGGPLTTADVADLETAVANRFPNWLAGLAAADLRQERRPLGLLPEHIGLEFPAPDAASDSDPVPDSVSEQGADHDSAQVSDVASGADSGQVLLCFTLPPGSYATAVLRELFYLD
ncbi:tRNA pseudouridine(13) synthase TruD [Thiohalocapsa marina]|uniref:tRNA pseudouridine(13) synthase TruD n=1 Tax=Thiohalocapsa marina TaxID=424902 RepID=UPI0036D958AD